MVNNHYLDFFVGHDTLIHQFLSVFINSRRCGADFTIHKRLSKHGLVNFIMAVTAIANNINYNVFVESCTPFRSYVAYVHYAFWVI